MGVTDGDAGSCGLLFIAPSPQLSRVYDE